MRPDVTERLFGSQFQVGQGSRPGHTERSLAWMKQRRNTSNPPACSLWSSDSGGELCISYMLLCNKLVLNLAASVIKHLVSHIFCGPGMDMAYLGPLTQDVYKDVII